jgi:hypothetical protein
MKFSVPDPLVVFQLILWDWFQSLGVLVAQWVAWRSLLTTAGDLCVTTPSIRQRLTLLADSLGSSMALCLSAMPENWGTLRVCENSFLEFRTGCMLVSGTAKCWAGSYGGQNSLFRITSRASNHKRKWVHWVQFRGQVFCLDLATGCDLIGFSPPYRILHSTCMLWGGTFPSDCQSSWVGGIGLG